MTARLIVNADDVGLTEGVNRAAVRGHLDGVVTSVSVLAVGRAFDHAAALLRDHPQLSVGAHLAVVGEDPPLLSAAEVPTLVDRRGRFPLGYRSVVLRAAAGRIDPGDLRRELGAQLERLRATGLEVSHVDTHQHTHLWPLVGRVVAGLADDTDIRWVRLPTSRAPGPVGVVVRRLSARLGRRLDALGRRVPDAYAGLDEAGRMDRDRFARALAAVAVDLPAGGVAEINVHPGEPGDPERDRFAWDYHWEDELSMLTHPETSALVRGHQLDLCSFGRLAGGGQVTALASRRPDRAGREALAQYRDAGRAARLHTMVRWWSAPFPAIERALPESGRVLEIGCGHGLFSTYAALAAPGRTVHGVDIDPDKIAAAQAAGRHLTDRVTFAVAPSGAVPDGPWDAVVIVDVLYLLPEAAQRSLLLEAAAEVAPGGVLVVKEMSPTPRWKARWNSAQETLAVKLLRITEGGSFDFVPPGRVSAWLRGLGATVREQRLDAGRIHPHHLVVATLPPEPRSS